MIETSQAYKSAVRGPNRQVRARVTVDYTDPLVDRTLGIAVNEQAWISWPEQTADNRERVSYFWASLDGTWKAGDMRRLMPDTEESLRGYQVGWWGRQLADSNGAFAAPYPTLTITHAPRLVGQMKAIGDSARGEYPVEFFVRFFSADDSLLAEEHVTDNADVRWEIILSDRVPDVARQELEIRQWSHPGRQVKIAEFFSSVQEIYDGQDLINVQLFEEFESSRGLVPTISSNELSVRFHNDGRFDFDDVESPLYGLLRPNRRVQAWLGVETPHGVEWVPLGVFWTIAWDTQDETLEASTRARDRLELLRLSTYYAGEAQSDVSVYDVLDDIFLDAGLNTYDYDIDPELHTYILPWAWFTPMDHREALRTVAEAVAAVVYCGRDGVIYVRMGKGFDVITTSQPYFLSNRQTVEAEASDVYDIGAADYFLPLRHVSHHDKLTNEVVVATQPLRPVPDQELYRATVTTPTTVTIRYRKTPAVDVNVYLDEYHPDINITHVRQYAWGADIQIEGEGEATIVAMGTALEPDGGEQVTLRDEESIIENGVLRYEHPGNPLVQTVAQADLIAGRMLSTGLAQRDVEIRWRGNPALEVGDPVAVTTDKSRRGLYQTIQQDLEWNGVLEARLVGRWHG